MPDQRSEPLPSLRSIIAVSLALLWLATADGFVLAKVTSPPDTWIITQSSNFAGEVSSEIAPNAMRMRISRLGLTIVTRAPEWTAYIYNENNKNYVEIPKGELGKRLILSQKIKATDKNGLPLLTSQRTGRSQTIGGHKASEIRVFRKADPEVGRQSSTTELWIASDIAAPPEISEVFCQHLNIPVQQGIPLRVALQKSDKRISVLDTVTIKRGKVSQEIFAPMKGYRKVKDELQLLMEDSTQDVLEGLDANTHSKKGQEH